MGNLFDDENYSSLPNTVAPDEGSYDVDLAETDLKCPAGEQMGPDPDCTLDLGERVTVAEDKTSSHTHHSVPFAGKSEGRMGFRTAVALSVGLLAIALGLLACKDKLPGGELITQAAETLMHESESPTEEAAEEDSRPEKWQEGIISYEGKDYKFNDRLHIYLIMGVDKDGVVEEAPDYQSGGQSDAMFLLVTDPDTMEMKIVAINRNTMTNIYVTNAEGTHLNDVTAQICLQHAYGDGKKLSCTRAVNAVSYLFYNLPIDGYFALNMGGIPAMNDAVGGVRLKALQDLSYPEHNVDIKAGKAITLKGMEAYYYLRARDTKEFGSADLRLKRQNQYIQSFLKVLKEEVNAVGAVNLYNSVSDYLVTDMKFADVVKDIMKYDFEESEILNMPGETVMGEIYEEFHVDDEAFYQMNLELFYKEVN